MPLYYQKTASDKDPLVYAIWKISENEEELMDAIPYGNELKEYASQHFKACSRRTEWLAVRRLLHELGTDARDVCYLPSGRPYLKGKGAPHLSITHSRGYAAVALHPLKPIGIDMEKKGEKVMRVRKRFVSEHEECHLVAKAHGEDETRDILLTLWSAKETMFKLLDLPGIDFAEHLHVSPFAWSGEGEFEAHETYTDKRQEFGIGYRIFPDFVLTYGAAM